MAEIRIRKKSKPVWPWLLGIIILLAAIWLMVEFAFTDEGFRFEGNQNTEVDSSQYNIENYPTETRRIDDFIALVNDESFLEEEVDAEKAREGMQLLSVALNELIEEQSILNQEILADRKVLAEQLNLNHSDKNNTDSVSVDELSRSFYTAANLIDGIQQEQFPELETEVSEVKNSALSINPSEEVSKQEKQVKDFFIKTSLALQSMRDGHYEELNVGVTEEVRLIEDTK